MMFMITNLLQLPLELWNPPLEQVERLWERQRQPPYTAEKLMRDQAGFAIQSEDVSQAALSTRYSEARYEMEVRR